MLITEFAHATGIIDPNRQLTNTSNVLSFCELLLWLSNLMMRRAV